MNIYTRQKGRQKVSCVYIYMYIYTYDTYTYTYEYVHASERVSESLVCSVFFCMV